MLYLYCLNIAFYIYLFPFQLTWTQQKAMLLPVPAGERGSAPLPVQIGAAAAWCSLGIGVSPAVPRGLRGVSIPAPSSPQRWSAQLCPGWCYPALERCCFPCSFLLRVSAVFPAPRLNESWHSLEERGIKNVTGSCTIVWMKRRCYLKTFENT